MEESPSARSRVYNGEHVEAQVGDAPSRDDGMSITLLFGRGEGAKI